MNHEEPIDPRLVIAMRHFDTSAMNGLLCVVTRLRGAGLLDDLHIRDLHEQISLPFADPVDAGNPYIPSMQDYIDRTFATLLGYIRP